MPILKVAVFPDTNLFLHFRPLNEIDWCAVLNASNVEIKIAPVVTHELEEKKVLHPLQKIRERANKALRLLHTYLQKPQVREGVILELLTKEATADSARFHGLNFQLGDDRLIGSICSYQQDHPDIPCLLVTNDLPLTVKATHYQIPLAPLDDSFQLPQEPDTAEKKIKQLEQELLKYKSREPVLSVTFENGEQYMRFQIGEPGGVAPNQEKEIQTKIDEIKKEYPLLETTPRVSGQPAPTTSPLLNFTEQMQQALQGLSDLSRQARENYNERMFSYHSAFERYLRGTIDFPDRQKRTLKLSLILDNTGTCPAEDIHVLLHFPNGFTLYDEKHIPAQPTEPEAPSKELNLLPSTYLFQTFAGIEPRIPLPRNPNLPTIRKTNSYDVTFERPKLNHGFIYELGPLFVSFDSWDSVGSFSIKYIVHAANLIEEKRGELGVVVDRK